MQAFQILNIFIHSRSLFINFIGFDGDRNAVDEARVGLSVYPQRWPGLRVTQSDFSLG